MWRKVIGFLTFRGLPIHLAAPEVPHRFGKEVREREHDREIHRCKLQAQAEYQQCLRDKRNEHPAALEGLTIANAKTTRCHVDFVGCC